MIVVATLGAAPRAGRLRRSRARESAPEPPPTEVPTSRVTLIPATPLESEGAGVSAMRDDPETQVAAAVRSLNELLHLHRVAIADPYMHEVSREQALVARVGYGRGGQVADGKWTEAVELPRLRARRQRRTAALRPQERLAALLGGRDLALAAEALILRARADHDAGRMREAALQLRIGLEAALSELAADGPHPGMDERVAELRELRGSVGDSANAALNGPLDNPTAGSVSQVLGRVEAALRARSAAERWARED